VLDQRDEVMYILQHSKTGTGDSRQYSEVVQKIGRKGMSTVVEMKGGLISLAQSCATAHCD